VIWFDDIFNAEVIDVIVEMDLNPVSVSRMMSQRPAHSASQFCRTFGHTLRTHGHFTSDTACTLVFVIRPSSLAIVKKTAMCDAGLFGARTAGNSQVSRLRIKMK